MYLLSVYQGISKESKRPFLALSVLNDNRDTVKKFFASQELQKKGIDENLISNPENGFVEVEMVADPFKGVTNIAAV